MEDNEFLLGLLEVCGAVSKDKRAGDIVTWGRVKDNKIIGMNGEIWPEGYSWCISSITNEGEIYKIRLKKIS